MKNTIALFLLVMLFASCENPYEHVSEDKYYTGNPFVSLSSEQAAIRLSVNESTNHSLQAGEFKDSLILSHTLDQTILVTLEIVNEATQGTIDEHFAFQQTVMIEAGQNYGSFTVNALNIPEDEVSQYKLAIRIKEVDNEQIIAGLYGTKKENEPRQKRFKTYSFQK